MDTMCGKCGEPWDHYGVNHGDMTAGEAARFKRGEGCPCCKFGTACPGCNGVGFPLYDPAQVPPCVDCDGTGKLTVKCQDRGGATFRCEECGGVDVLVIAEVNPNTMEVNQYHPLGDGPWCKDCKQHVGLVEHD